MIVVTGASGVLGRALVDHLERAGQSVIALTSKDIDLRDQGATHRFFQEARASLIFHCAAKVHGLGGNQRYPGQMFTDNIRINTNVVDAACASGCKKLVAVSTVAIYSATAAMPISERSIWESAPHGSEAAYGHAKRAMLAQLDAYKMQYGMDYAYSIMTNLYGPHDRFDTELGHVLPSLVAKFYNGKKNGEPVSVWGTGVAERDFLYCGDAARALEVISREVSGPVNVASGEVIKIRDAVEFLKSYVGGVELIWDATKPDGQILRRFDLANLRSLGFTPQVRAFDGIAMTYDWYASSYPNVRT